MSARPNRVIITVSL